MNDAQAPSAADLGRKFASHDAFMRHMGIKIMRLGPGTSELRMKVQPYHMNFNETCHGGALFALADSAFGCAANSHGVLSAGIDTHMTFQAGVNEGDILIATAKEVSHSRKIAVYRVEVTGSAGALVAGFTGTVYVTGKSHGA